MADARATLLKQVLAVTKGWDGPHGHGSLATSERLVAVDATGPAEVQLAIRPSRPHCPCCVLDLVDLRAALLDRKGIERVHIEVVGVPAAERWTTAVNR